MMRIFLLALGLLSACQSSPSNTESIVRKSKPHKGAEIVPETPYTIVFRELPLAASLSRLPWASDSWTSLHGGAAFRWQLAQAEGSDDKEDLEPFIHYPLGQSSDPKTLSPIEKLDLFLGNKTWDLTQKEKARTFGQKNPDGTPRKDIPEWEGIMHAWSRASLQFEPVAPVTLQNPSGESVTFETQDIYGLLSLFVHGEAPRSEVLASACPTDGAFGGAAPYAFENEKQNLRRAGCDEIDAATFHIVLTNQIGKRNEGFIMDRDHSGEISNNPVVAYESRIMETPGLPPLPGTERRVRLRTVVFLTAETPLVTLDADEEAYPYETESFEYELSLDKDGRITSGQWLKEKGELANQSIPDFLWKSKRVWLSGPIKNIYEQAREKFADFKDRKQLRPIEDMPVPERQSYNGYFNQRESSF